MKFVDCLVSDAATAEKAREWGWDSAVAAGKTGKSPHAAVIERDVGKSAKKALDSGADLVYASGGPEEVNREAAESWEVDVLLHPEKGAERDFMDQKNSGLDQVLSKLMAERGMMLGVVLSDVLEIYGGKRVQLLGRVRQNIMLAQKYKIPIVYCSGAAGELGLRTPRDAAALLSTLGVQNPMKAVSDNPALLLSKARERKDPNILTKGLKVVNWGEAAQPRAKKLYGWL